MAFDYPVNLDLSDRRVVVFGGGALAYARVARLVDVGATVTVVSEKLDDRLAALPVTHIARVGAPDDLQGAFLAIATGEDTAPVPELYDAASRRGVLFATIDDVDHSDFGAASEIRRGDLQITISTAGKAPALSKRLRRQLETTVDEGYGEIVEVLHRARERLLPRTVPFEAWAAAWGQALDDLDDLVALVRSGRGEEAEERVVSRVAQAH